MENGFGMAYLEQIMYNVWCQRKQKPVMVPKVYMGSTFKGGKRWRKDYKRHAWVSLQLHILKTLTKTSYTDRSNQCQFFNIWQSSISTTVSAYNVISINKDMVYYLCQLGRSKNQSIDVKWAWFCTIWRNLSFTDVEWCCDINSFHKLCTRVSNTNRFLHNEWNINIVYGIS